LLNLINDGFILHATSPKDGAKPTFLHGLYLSEAFEVDPEDLGLLAADLGREVQIISRGGLDNARHAEIFRDMIRAF
jgi:hypothetical protein